VNDKMMVQIAGIHTNTMWMVDGMPTIKHSHALSLKDSWL
jgi:hypothetical protein